METPAIHENGTASGAWPESVEARLRELRAELRAGEAQMEELDLRRARLRDTMLRIGGAIQVLEELLHTRALVTPEPDAVSADA